MLEVSIVNLVSVSCTQLEFCSPQLSYIFPGAVDIQKRCDLSRDISMKSSREFVEFRVFTWSDENRKTYKQLGKIRIHIPTTFPAYIYISIIFPWFLLKSMLKQLKSHKRTTFFAVDPMQLQPPRPRRRRFGDRAARPPKRRKRGSKGWSEKRGRSWTWWRMEKLWVYNHLVD